MSPTLTGLFIAIACLPAANPPATGPLRAHPENPRYFADASGKAVLIRKDDKLCWRRRDLDAGEGGRR